MVTVPRFGDRRVPEVPLPVARQIPTPPIEAFGGGREIAGVFEAAGGLIGDIQKQAEQQREIANRTLFNELETELLRERTELTTAQRESQGKNAIGSSDQSMAQFQRRFAELSSGVQDPAVREALDAAFQKHSIQMRAALETHERGQTEVYQNETFKNSLTIRQQNAVQTPDDRANIALNIAEGAALISDYAADTGKSQEWQESMIRGFQSGVHVGVIQQMMSEQRDLDAEEYFKSVEAQIEPEDAAKIRSAVQEGSRRGESARLAELLAAEAGMTIERARARLSSLTKDQSIRDEALRRFKGILSDRQDDEQLRLEGQFKSAIDTISITRSLDSVPAHIWAELTDRQTKILERMVTADKSPVETDWKTYYGLEIMAADARTQKEFINTNLYDFRDKLADVEFKRLVSIQQDLRKGQQRDAEKLLEGVLSKKEIVDNVLRSSANLNPNTREDTKKQRIANFRSVVDRRVTAFQVDNRRKATSREIEEIAKEALRDEVFIQRSFIFDVFSPDPAKPAATVLETEFGQAYVPIENIPRKVIDRYILRLGSLQKLYTVDKAQRLRAAELIGSLELYESILAETP